MAERTSKRNGPPMKHWQRLFQREMDVLHRARDRFARAAATLRRRRQARDLGPRPEGRRGAGAAAATPPATAAGPLPPGRPIPLKRRRLRASARGIGLSLILHAAIGGFLVLLDRGPPRTPGPLQEKVIHLRLLPAARRSSPPAVELPRPEPEPETVRDLVRQPQPIEPSRPEATETPALEEEHPAAAPRVADLEAPPLPAPRLPGPDIAGPGPGSPPARPDAAAGSGPFSGRSGAGRARALRRNGGTPGTEEAVLRGLAWLAAHQDGDGKWDADGFNRHCLHISQCFGKGQPEFDVGLSGLALLAFLGAGHSPAGDSIHRGVVDRGLRFLLKAQEPDGRFGPRSERFFYNHALATLAVLEGYGMSKSPDLLSAALEALQFSARAQQAGGGWDYTDEATGRNDLSITGWQVMAIHAAEALRVPVPPEMVARVRAQLEVCVLPSGAAIYASQGIGAGRSGPNMAAVGMLSRLYTGTGPADPGIQGAVRILLRNLPELEKTFEWDRHFQSSYYWYVGALAIFQLGGPAWEAWNRSIQQAILPHQNRSPHEDGSWEPDGNWIGASGGRVAATAFNVLTLEVYYRYPPLHAYR